MFHFSFLSHGSLENAPWQLTPLVALPAAASLPGLGFKGLWVKVGHKGVCRSYIGAISGHYPNDGATNGKEHGKRHGN